VEQPVRELKGFARVTLQPGEQKHVELPLGFNELDFVNGENKWTVEPTVYQVWVGGNSLAGAGVNLQIVE
jgi:beta-glucosidase